MICDNGRQARGECGVDFGMEARSDMAILRIG